jgi:hypothetical protein
MMKSIELLTDSELDEIIDGCVDGVYPTWQEVSMATELKTRRVNLAAESRITCDTVAVAADMNRYHPFQSAQNETSTISKRRRYSPIPRHQSTRYRLSL